jgi:hypothetical protein
MSTKFNGLKKTILWSFIKTVHLPQVVHFFRRKIFYNRIAVVVEKDLSTMQPAQEVRLPPTMTLVEISRDMIGIEAHDRSRIRYPTVNDFDGRRQKALRYFARGYRGIALVKDNQIIGDIWYVCASPGKATTEHPDLKWLGIRCNPNEVYAFDMFIYPQNRGDNLATVLQNGAFHEIRKAGFLKVFGYYWANYLPALWVHRMVKWKNIRRVTVSRFFSIYFHD